MRKLLLFLSALFVLTLIIPSCSSSKTYAELLQDEKDNIAQLIADSFEIIPFNKDTLYNPKHPKLMKLDNGSYIAIISRGNTNSADSAVANLTEVTYRFKYGRVLTDGDTTVYTNTQSAYPFEFVYGSSSTAFSSLNPVCEAIQAPLSFYKFGLGDGAKIKIIIPAKISFTDFQSAVTTIYFPELTYKFYE